MPGKVQERINKMAQTRRDALWDDLCRLMGYGSYAKDGASNHCSHFLVKYDISRDELEAAFKILRSIHEEVVVPERHFKEVLPIADTREESPKLRAVPDENWGKKEAPKKPVKPKPSGKWGTNTPKQYEASYHIDALGSLMVMRAGRYVHQSCPHGGMGDCGDTCSHFREPVFREAKVHIPICMGTVLICHVKNFMDERHEETE